MYVSLMNRIVDHWLCVRYATQLQVCTAISNPLRAIQATSHRTNGWTGKVMDGCMDWWMIGWVGAWMHRWILCSYCLPVMQADINHPSTSRIHVLQHCRPPSDLHHPARRMLWHSHHNAHRCPVHAIPHTPTPTQFRTGHQQCFICHCTPRHLDISGSWGG